MSPDGNPIVGLTKDYSNLINIIGLSGQGFMLGPGLGELVTRIIAQNLSKLDTEVLDEFSLYRDFSSVEKLK